MLSAAAGSTGASRGAGERYAATAWPVTAFSTLAEPAGLTPDPAWGQSTASSRGAPAAWLSSMIGHVDTRSMAIRFPVLTFHRKTVPSALPDATTSPAALIAARSGVGPK